MRRKRREWIGMTLSETPWQPEIDPQEAVSEDYVARMFTIKYRNKLAFSHAKGAWAEFDEVWRFTSMPIAFHYCRELSRQMSESSKSKTSLQKSSFARGVEAFARADPVFSRDHAGWDNDPFLLGTPAGTVDLRTGRLRLSSAVDWITKSTLTPPLPKAECPTWLRFLEDSTAGDAELIRYLQQTCGYALTGDTREHALFFVYGPGGNGKSVFLSVLTEIMGDYATTAAMDSFTANKFAGHPTDLAGMQGARLVTASETEEGRAWAEARIKSLTGGDMIRARFMRQDFFEFRPEFKLVIVGNHQPELRQVDDAMRRRFNIIPFTVTPPAPDRALLDKLRPEYPGILRWMIDGCLDWQANGLVVPSVVKTATRSYFDEQDTMNQWLEADCVHDVSNFWLSAPVTALYASWSSYAKASGVEGGSVKSFSQMLAKRGYQRKKLSSGAWFDGVQLKPSNDRSE